MSKTEDTRTGYTLFEFIVYPRDLFKIYTPVYSDKYQCNNFIDHYIIGDPFPDLDDKTLWDHSRQQKVTNFLFDKLSSFQDERGLNGHMFNFAFCCHYCDFPYTEDDQVEALHRERVNHVHYHVCILFLDTVRITEWESEACSFMRLFNIVQVEQFEHQHRNNIYTFERLRCAVSKHGNLIRVQPAKYPDSKLRYLIHRGFPLKYQYPFTDIISDVDISLHNAFIEERQQSILANILSYASSGQCSDYTQLVFWCLERRWIKEYKKYESTIKTVFSNEMFKRNKPKLANYEDGYLPEIKDPFTLSNIFKNEIPWYYDTSCFYLDQSVIAPDVPEERLIGD